MNPRKLENLYSIFMEGVKKHWKICLVPLKIHMGMAQGLLTKNLYQEPCVSMAYTDIEYVKYLLQKQFVIKNSVTTPYITRGQ